MKWKLSRNQLSVGSGLLLGVLFLLQYLSSTEVISCGDDPHLTCYFFLERLNAFGFGLIPLFVFSVVLRFTREDIFNAWLIKVAYIYLLALVLVTSVLSPSNGGYIFSSDLSTVLLLTVLTFVVVTPIYVGWKYISKRPEGE